MSAHAPLPSEFYPTGPRVWRSQVASSHEKENSFRLWQPCFWSPPCFVHTVCLHTGWYLHFAQSPWWRYKDTLMLFLVLHCETAQASKPPLPLALHVPVRNSPIVWWSVSLCVRWDFNSRVCIRMNYRNRYGNPLQLMKGPRLEAVIVFVYFCKLSA